MATLKKLTNVPVVAELEHQFFNNPDYIYHQMMQILVIYV